MDSAVGRAPTEGPVEQALALAGALSRATGLIVETGASQTLWGVSDPGGHLPVVKTALVVRDVGADGQFSANPVVLCLQVRTLVAVPLQADAQRPVVGTLWALSSSPQAFDNEQVAALTRVGTIIGGLLSPVTPKADLERLVMALPTPAVAVVGDRVLPNAPACALTGFGGEEVTTLGDWFKALYRDDGSMVRELYEADRAQGFLDARTAPITRKDGWERLVQVHCTTVGDRKSVV